MNLTNLRHTAASALVLAALTLAGCASTGSDMHQYLLRDSSAPLRANEQASVAISQLTLPDYLYDDAIVLLLDDQQMHSARVHRWAEPSHTAIKRYLTQRIASRFAQQGEIQPVRLEIGIDELIGNVDGDISLRASYRFKRPDGTQRSGRVNRQLQQPADGYPGLVAGHAAILDELAAMIANDLSNQIGR